MRREQKRSYWGRPLFTSVIKCIAVRLFSSTLVGEDEEEDQGLDPDRTDEIYRLKEMVQFWRLWIKGEEQEQITECLLLILIPRQ